MMDKSFGLILAVIALIAGVMLLTGHGDILLKGGNAKLRKDVYKRQRSFRKQQEMREVQK